MKKWDMTETSSPASPEEMDWSTHYPKFFDEEGKAKDGKQVEWADVGCGFGGLLMSLAPQFPDTLMLGTSPSLLILLSQELKNLMNRNGNKNSSSSLRK
jgi:tRNA G46 methylase TrmB